MSIWVNDAELFLYKPHKPNTGPAQLWRCKNMTASVPLKVADFIPEVRVVTSHLQLVGASSGWSEQNYKNLLAYITENHFLVNCKGEVFLENFPFDSTRRIDLSRVVYLRAADAINMRKYGFPLPPEVDIPNVPFRTVKYLDSNPVKDAEMEP